MALSLVALVLILLGGHSRKQEQTLQTLEPPAQTGLVLETACSQREPLSSQQSCRPFPDCNSHSAERATDFREPPEEEQKVAGARDPAGQVLAQNKREPGNSVRVSTGQAGVCPGVTWLQPELPLPLQPQLGRGTGQSTSYLDGGLFWGPLQAPDFKWERGSVVKLPW